MVRPFITDCATRPCCAQSQIGVSPARPWWSALNQAANSASLATSLNPSATPSPGVAEPDGPRNRLTRNGPAGAVPALRTLNDAVIGRPVPANAGPLTAVICRSIKSSSIGTSRASRAPSGTTTMSDRVMPRSAGGRSPVIVASLPPSRTARTASAEPSRAALTAASAPTPPLVSARTCAGQSGS